MIAKTDDSGGTADGGGGALFVRPDNRRSDARLVARMLSLGVVKPSRVRELLRQGFDLASASAHKGDARGYSACMKIAIEAAKLEQKERPSQHEHRHQHTGAIAIEPRRVELLTIIDSLSERAGAGKDTDATNGHGANGNGKGISGPAAD